MYAGEPTGRACNLENIFHGSQGAAHTRLQEQEDLHAVLENALVRRKLVRFLRDQFRWPYSERVEFYDDFMPYSFIFKEIRGGEPVMTGGLILHGQEDLEHAYYSMHT